MTAIVKTSGWTAVLSRGRWVCNEERLEKILNEQLQRDKEELSGSDPNPEHTLAQKAATAFGGTVEEYDIPKFNPDVVY